MSEKLSNSTEQSPSISKYNTKYDSFDPEAAKNAKEARIKELNDIAERNGSLEKELKEDFDKDIKEINSLMTEEVPDLATFKKIDALMSESEKYNNELGKNGDKDFPRLMEQFRNVAA